MQRRVYAATVAASPNLRTRLIVVDPRRIELADYADIHLAVKPGHNVELFNAIAATIIEENLVDRDFIARRVDDFENFATFVSDYAPEKIAALWSIGYDIFLSLANATATAHALQQLELVIVQDLFLNETAKEFGTVFFPAASVFEKDGTFMNADQRVRRSLAPRGDSQPDCTMATRCASPVATAKWRYH